MNRAIFPLPIFLLPDGFTRLKIFEDRYLFMVKDALKNNKGFVLCTFEDNAHLNTPTDGVYVKIVNFSQDKSGQLLIDVHATHRVKIYNVCQDKQKLRHADIELYDDYFWPYDVSNTESFDKSMSDMLKNVFKDNDIINNLYDKQDFDSPIWVISRWLELLPISIDNKIKIRHVTTFEQVTDFVHNILYAKE